MNTGLYILACTSRQVKVIKECVSHILYVSKIIYNSSSTPIFSGIIPFCHRVYHHHYLLLYFPALSASSTTITSHSTLCHWQAYRSFIFMSSTPSSTPPATPRTPEKFTTFLAGRYASLQDARTVSGTRASRKFNSYVYTRKLLIRKTLQDDPGLHRIFCTHCTKGQWTVDAFYKVESLEIARDHLHFYETSRAQAYLRLGYCRNQRGEPDRAGRQRAFGGRAHWEH